MNKKLYAVIVGFISLGVVDAMFETAQACDFSTCGIGFSCRWYPAYGYSSCPSTEVDGICAMLTNPVRCETVIEKYESENTYKVVGELGRPSGECSQIPCGECTTSFRLRACGYYYQCSPEYDEEDNIIGCVWEICQTVSDAGYFMLDNYYECCNWS
ncbi:MAG: hypothetical protein IPK83_05915 [Planctomycetes bacterium]|nr:hypothetical protein [Planctomycetota bacterium]